MRTPGPVHTLKSPTAVSVISIGAEPLSLLIVIRMVGAFAVAVGNVDSITSKVETVASGRVIRASLISRTGARYTWLRQRLRAEPQPCDSRDHQGNGSYASRRTMLT